MNAGVNPIKKVKFYSRIVPGNSGRVSDFDLDDLRMNGCNDGVQFRLLSLSHLLDLFPDPGNRLALSAAMTASSRDLNATGGKSAFLVGFRDDGIVHDRTEWMQT